MIIGLVGKPSAGKSSFFKAATMIDVKISPVPFTTTKPNLGNGHVIIDCAEKEFGKKCNPKSGFCKNGKRFVPVKLVDVAGLVPGAHEGKGLGNQFLDDLRQASALIHIVDASGLTDEQGNPTSGHDPSADIKFLENEIDLWISSIVQKATPKISKAKSKFDILQIMIEQLSGLGIGKEIEILFEKNPKVDSIEFAREIRKISKPILIAANKIDLKVARENFEKIKGIENTIPTSADAEIALKRAAEKNLIEYLPGNGFEIKGDLEERQKQALDTIKKEVIERYGSTGVQKCLNDAVFSLLDYIAVYPVANAGKLSDKDGNVLPDVFLVPKGTTVRQLAFKIHSSIGEKFIAGIDAKTRRRLGSDHELKNNDVVEIAFAK